MSGDNTMGLVQINSRKNNEESTDNGLSRRTFLKGLGVGAAAVTVAGCADDHATKILPFVRGEEAQIPGIPVWYRSTCTECTAGCGVLVKTREGRAIKVEGSVDNPINQGGLCALGQSSLQNLYDPDRVRQPLERVQDVDKSIRIIYNNKPITWDAGLDRVAAVLKDGTKKKALITGELSGANEELVQAFCDTYGVTHVVYDPMQPVALAKAHEIVFGTYGIPHYQLEKAEVVLNFGADFLETFVSPVEFARAWSKGRKGDRPSKIIHIEPRLSLSGSNADLWLSAKPGTEVQLALFLAKSLLEVGRGDNLPAAARIKLNEIVKGIELNDVARDTGISKEKILLVARALKDARSSLVIAGGAAASTDDPLPLQVAVCFLNLLLENVGKTIDLGQMRKPKSSVEKMKQLIAQFTSKDNGIDLLMVYGTNPAFTLPSGYGFETSRSSIPMMVSFASHLDETATLANLILPSHTGLESWGDVRPYTGVYSLMQPSMRPVFETKQFGDTLLALASKAGKPIAKEESFELFLKGSWQKLFQQLDVSGDFAKFWLESVERGGYFPNNSSSTKGNVNADALSRSFAAAHFANPQIAEATEKNSLVVFPYYSVRSFDGRAANRPWLQELPDPVVTAVWDAWAEIHPETAAKLGLAKGDVVTIRNKFGEVNVGVYLSQYVHRDVVALPIGQGHTAYGRYAMDVGGSGNVFNLIPPSSDKNVGGVSLLSTEAYVARGRGKSELLIMAGSDSQMGRGLSQSKVVQVGTGVAGLEAAYEANAKHAAGAHHAEEGEHGEGEEHGHGPVKQMYKQREHPLYRWGMTVDLSSCTGCSACVVACYAENNIPVVGRQQVYKGREMAWLRIERYFDGSAEELQVNFLPMMCQHCGNAPCEPVCPVYATYHNEEGLNAMIYNRCVGTRYCSNNCSYKVRRFNWFEYTMPEPLNWQLNPDVTKRIVGIMEKCTFCVQRISEGKDHAKDEGRYVRDGEIKPACVQGCPTQALSFGNLNDPDSEVSKKSADPRAYKVLDKWINTQPAVSYLKRVRVEV